MSVTQRVGDIAHLLHVTTLRNAQVGHAVMVHLVSVLRCIVSTLKTVGRLVVPIQRLAQTFQDPAGSLSMVLKMVFSNLSGGKAVQLSMGSLASTCNDGNEHVRKYLIICKNGSCL
eukprot:TRINITY_DN12625_c1_g2_i11.p1 TRINITY_DN12625_c1_g2~~TRINITY_DN12625_c1_g2_i11.p1  ORF type:complete len:116 (-),score=13.34 TRINITY_DN12625_c1_g2_i11:2079-2426(-)